MLSPFNRGGRIDFMETARTLSLHLLLLWTSFKFRPAFKRSFCTCFLHVLFGRLLFLRSSTLNSKAFLTASPSSFSKHAPTFSLHLLWPFYLWFDSNPAYPSYLLNFSCPLVWHHTLLSPLLFLFFSRSPFFFLSNTRFHCHTTSQTRRNSDKLLLVSLAKIFFKQ